MNKRTPSVGVLVLKTFLILEFMVLGRNEKEETLIEEIPNTHLMAVGNATDYRYFVVKNPPEGLDSLKELAKKHFEYNINDLTNITASDLGSEGQVYGSGLKKIEPKELSYVKRPSLAELLA